MIRRYEENGGEGADTGSDIFELHCLTKSSAAAGESERRLIAYGEVFHNLLRGFIGAASGWNARLTNRPGVAITGTVWMCSRTKKPLSNRTSSSRCSAERDARLFSGVSPTSASPSQTRQKSGRGWSAGSGQVAAKSLAPCPKWVHSSQHSLQESFNRSHPGREC